MTVGLPVILGLVLVLPFAFHKVEENIELFLFVMGLASSIISGTLNAKLVRDALVHPIEITVAVLVMGAAFKFTSRPMERGVRWLSEKVSQRAFIFGLIFLLGLLSSVITAIIASLVLVEIISVLTLDRKAEVRVVILACYSIGMGAALTPIGEPLSTIAVAKLAGEPYHATFWFLLKILGAWVLPGVFAFSALSLFVHGKNVGAGEESLSESPEDIRKDESFSMIFIRAARVFIFVMALVLLGEGFKPLIDRYVIHMHSLALYWINTVSAVLDNATLTAAEISPKMDLNQIRDILLGLLIAGGMLIPGNIPNIIAAGRLKIGMKEWAKFGAPIGAVVMLAYFAVLLIVQ